MPRKKIIVKKSKSPEGEQINIWEGIVTLDLPLILDDVTDCLHNIGKYGKTFPEGHCPSLDYCIHIIQRCLNEKRADLIEKAARLLQGEKKLLAMVMLRKTANACQDHLYWREEEDIIFPSKASVLQVFELMFPDLKEYIPTSKRQLAEWWKEADLDHLPQDRGASNTEAVNRWLKKLKENPSRTSPPRR